MVTYQLVPPGPYYKLYLAKTAVQAAEGEAPEVTEASEVLTVGKHSCDFARPERPFLATLTWKSIADIDLHVLKFDVAAVKAATNINELGQAVLDRMGMVLCFIGRTLRPSALQAGAQPMRHL